MTKNLQIFLLQEQIKDLITKSDLDVSIIYLMMKDLLVEIEQVYNNQIEFDYKKYLDESKEKQQEDESTIKTVDIDIVGQE